MSCSRGVPEFPSGILIQRISRLEKRGSEQIISFCHSIFQLLVTEVT